MGLSWGGKVISKRERAVVVKNVLKFFHYIESKGSEVSNAIRCHSKNAKLAEN